MAGVIQQLRETVGDDDAPYTYSEDTLQRVLDKYQTAHRMCPLTLVTARPSDANGVREFRAPSGPWEDGVQFINIGREVVTPTAWNPQTGIVALDRTQAALAGFVTGNTYCLPSAAADVCEMWASKLSRRFDTQDGEAKQSRSQMSKSLREQAQAFRAQVPLRSIGMTRSDV